MICATALSFAGGNFSSSCGGNSPGTANSIGNVYNVTTIRWPINQKTGWDGVTNGVGYGQTSGWPTNVPLNSNHSGGTNLLLLDGAVRFAADAMSMQTLAQLATRDDGGAGVDF